MFKRAFILFSLSLAPVSTQAGASAEKAIRQELTQFCQQVVMASSGMESKEYIASLFAQTLYQEVPVFRAPFPGWEEFRQIAVQETLRQMGEGIPTLFAQHGVACVAERSWRQEWEPQDFRAALQRAAQRSTPFRRRAGQRIAEVPWSEVAFTPSHPLLLKTLAIFQATRLPILAISQEIALGLQVDANTRTVQAALDAGIIRHYREALNFDDLANVMIGASTRYGVYNPVGTPPGIYIANYFTLAAVEEHLLHEMTHVAQDRTWNLIGLMDWFQRNVAHVLGDSHEERTSRIEFLSESKRRLFLEYTGDRAHRQQALDRGTALGFKNLDWVLFFDFFTLITELDAHRQGALLSRELGQLGDEFSTDAAIVKYVFQVYQAKMGVLSPLASVLEDSVEGLVRAVDLLNTHRRQS